ncbi:MAG: T9SS type A sorting domain-containing protein [Bacteroidetes bacterium]|nr:T9SS type A sorting domain-containing protein [Bacteroidota bacterium]
MSNFLHNPVLRNSQPVVFNMDIFEDDPSTEVQMGAETHNIILLNPASNTAYYRNEFFDIVNIEVFNISGQKMDIKFNLESQSIDISKISEGFYLIKFITEEEIITKSLIKFNYE